MSEKEMRLRRWEATHTASGWAFANPDGEEIVDVDLLWILAAVMRVPATGHGRSAAYAWKGTELAILLNLIDDGPNLQQASGFHSVMPFVRRFFSESLGLALLVASTAAVHGHLDPDIRHLDQAANERRLDLGLTVGALGEIVGEAKGRDQNSSPQLTLTQRREWDVAVSKAVPGERVALSWSWQRDDSMVVDHIEEVGKRRGFSDSRADMALDLNERLLSAVEESSSRVRSESRQVSYMLHDEHALWGSWFDPPVELLPPSSSRKRVYLGYAEGLEPSEIRTWGREGIAAVSWGSAVVAQAPLPAEEVPIDSDPTYREFEDMIAGPHTDRSSKTSSVVSRRRR